VIKYHFAWDCSEKQQGEGNKARKKSQSWKKIAPKKNEPEEQLKNEQLWTWCTRCGHWLLMHGTGEHKGLLKQKNLKGPHC